MGAGLRTFLLLSPKYMTRLWCVWELFTLFTFCNNELALQRVVVLPLVDFDESSAKAWSPKPTYSNATGSMWSLVYARTTRALSSVWAKLSAAWLACTGDSVQTEVGRSLPMFDINKAHCFDPNEELKLRLVINEIGYDKLEKVMNNLQGKFSKAVQRMRHKVEGQKGSD